MPQQANGYALADLGWEPFFEDQFSAYAAQGYIPARVALQHRDASVVWSEKGELRAVPTGRFAHGAASRADWPVVGDWVAVEPLPGEDRARLHAVLARRGRFARKVPGENTEEQILVANVDTVFLVSGLDGDFNLRRIERYLTTAWDSGADPVIVLNKADLCADAQERQAEVEAVAYGVPVYRLSAAHKQGLEALGGHLRPGGTVALLGSSGVGKSTLVNALAGADVQDTGGVRLDDSRGRHTTTHRELVRLAGGALLVDTPGLRELQLWGDGEDLEQTFEDIEALADQCRFRDCGHQGEPGCAVGAALDGGALDSKRYESYLKLRRELAYLERRQDQKAQQADRDRYKQISKFSRQLAKHSGKR